jgi:Fic family protein
MHRPAHGRYVTVTTAGEPFHAFVPVPLPPEPPVVWSVALGRRCNAALVGRGRLDVVTALLPNAARLLYSVVRKEAVLSSQIEGTPATVNKSLAHLERIGIVAELTNRQRGRVFSCVFQAIVAGHFRRT